MCIYVNRKFGRKIKILKGAFTHFFGNYIFYQPLEKIKIEEKYHENYRYFKVIFDIAFMKPETDFKI